MLLISLASVMVAIVYGLMFFVWGYIVGKEVEVEEPDEYINCVDEKSGKVEQFKIDARR